MEISTEIQEYCSSVPVTAVKIFDEIILTGEGRYLHVYEFCKNSNRSTFISHHRIFKNALIHGIKQNEENHFIICIYGGRYLKIVNFANDWKLISSSAEKLLSHWILDVNFKNNNLIVLLANNSALILDTLSFKIHYQITACEECSLFSGLIYFDSKFNEYIIMSGTFFNEILIWSFNSLLTFNHNSQHCNNLQAIILHRLKQHKGIITSIFYHNIKKLLLTSSDDRSIQLWHVGFLENNNADVCKSNWSSAIFTNLKTLYGHPSRIWKAVITNDFLISAGEDACCLVWNHNGEFIKRIKAHKGKNIWAIDINKDEDKLITGGGDGSIRIWNLKRKIENIKDNTLKIETNLNFNDYPRQVLFINYNLFLIVSMYGEFILHSILKNKCINLFLDSNFASYCFVATNYKEIIAIGSIHGVLKILVLNDLELETFLDIKIFNGKIFSILFLVNGSLILLTGPEGQMQLLMVIINKGEISTKLIEEFILPNCKQRWITCADIYNNYLICGDRHGNIFLYSLEEKNVNPIYCLEKIHGSNGVTFIKIDNGLIYSCGRNGILNIFEIESSKMILVQSNSIIKGFVWLTNIIFINEEIYILGFFSNKFVAYSLSYGEFIFEVECGGGHRSWDFQISSSENKIDIRFACVKQKIVVLIEQKFLCCQIIIKNSFGGSDLKAVQNISSNNSNSNADDFSNILLTCGEDGYINLTKIHENFINEIFHLQISSLLSIKVVPSNLRTLSFISNFNLSNGKQLRDGIIVSGGGGNIFKILSLKWKNLIPIDNFQHFDPLNTSKIIDYKNFPKCNKNSIYDIDKNINNKPHITTILVCDINKKLGKQKKTWKIVKEEEELPEARCMCIDTFSCLDKHIAIAVGTSMGIISLFIFHETEETCVLIWNTSFHSHCLTKIKYLRHSINFEKNLIANSSNIESAYENHQDYLCTTGTDGKIAIWNVTQIVHDYILFRNSHKLNLCGYDSRKINLDLIDSNLTADVDNSVNFDISDSANIPIDLNLSNNANLLNYNLGRKFNLNIENKDFFLNTGDPYMLLSGHQSGINALDLVHIIENKYILVTGGDDNLIHLFFIDINQKNIITEKKHEFAHSAQITGIKFLDEIHLVSISIDQRLIVWKIDDFYNLNIFPLFSSITDVADVSDISSSKLNSDNGISKYCVTVVGVGIQTFKISLPSNC